MKLLFVAFFACFTLLAPNAQAHIPGQKPFFKINGRYTELYSSPNPSSYTEAPQDIAPESYKVGEKLVMEFDLKTIPIPKEILNKSKIVWDFGDKTYGQGLAQKHSYTQAGKYISAIYIEYDINPPQLIQSTLITVKKDFTLFFMLGGIFLAGGIVFVCLKVIRKRSLPTDTTN